MTERKLVPHIRFKGFKEEWEIHKFEEDILSIHTGTNILSSEEYGGIPLIKMGNLRNGHFDFLKLEYLPTNKKVDEKYKIRYGDFLFNTRNTLELVGKGATWMFKSNEYAFNNNIARFNFKKSINTIFFNYLYNTKKTMKQIHARATGTTSVAAIYPRYLDSVSYEVPNIKEQQKIGNLFAKLDRLLDLQQQKLDQLELLKKALLQKLFPKQGTEIPELRFKGFEDEWKTNALQEISKIVGGGTPDTNKAEYWNGDINWYSPTEIGKKPFAYSSNKKISKIGLKKSSAKLLPANKTVLFTSRAGIGDMAILKTPAATNQGFQSLELKDNVYPYFVYSYGFEIKRKAKKLASGSTFLEISNKDMKRITLEFPNVKEQQKIGTFFAKIDRLIELENKKFSNLKLVKKSLLQNMFVE